jgi:hypothetical protein
MTRLLLVAAFAAFSALAAGPASAAFDVSYEQDTRADLRAWCVSDGGVLSDREDYTMCIAEERGATFTCDDDGACIATGFDLSTGSIGNRAVPTLDVAPFDSGHAHGLVVEGLANPGLVTADPITTGSIKPSPSPYLPYTGHGGLDIIE